MKLSPAQHAVPSEVVEMPVAIRYVKYLLATADGRKNSRYYLAKAGIDKSLLDLEEATVSTVEYAKLVKAMLSLNKDESFGFVRSGIKIGSFAMMCQVVCTCETLRQAAKKAFRFYSLIVDDFSVYLRQDHEKAWLELELKSQLMGPTGFFVEATFAVLMRLFAWLIDRPIPILAVDFGYAADLSGFSYEGRVVGLVRFDQTHSRLYFPAHFLNEKIKRSRLELQEFLEKETHRLFSDFRSDESVATLIRRMIAQKDSLLQQPLDYFAKELNSSPTSLRRKLRAEGQSFQSIRDQIRKQKAIYLLQYTHDGVEAIAAATGYSESATFHRAFKKWLGQTPQAFRQNRQQQSPSHTPHNGHTSERQ